MNHSAAFLTCLGVIYTIAFLSYFVQYPALSSQSGIEPAGRVLRHFFPGLHQFVKLEYVDLDTLVELVNILGAMISMTIASGVAQHGLLFIAVSVIYNFLVILGGSFYTFQWDTLLVEAGFLTALCLAPWQTLKLKSRLQNSDNCDDSIVGSWPLRFLLFKLMFMSGVVKIQADCPTWQNLTALEYHFATQCLPGPLSWHAHQLHPLFLRLGVAATFVIEIPATFLLLFPSSRVRKVGAWMQIFLQVLIIATGNYNFFNLLTVALCLPCMIGSGSSEKKNDWDNLQMITGTIFLSYSCYEMFALKKVRGTMNNVGSNEIGISLALTKNDCNRLSEIGVPAAMSFTLLSTSLAGIQDICRQTSNRSRLGSLVRVAICSFCIVVTALPLFDLTPRLQQSTFFGVNINSNNLQNIRKASFTNGYGLFRRMTGVGNLSGVDQSSEHVGWAGLKPSIVARPEIILEAIIEDTESESQFGDGEEWQELRFRWKPGNTSQRPLQVAPHQPRLDWRMWFAALGSYHHNPWLISFINKLLRGCTPVVELLDEPEIVAGKRKIVRIKASLYEYDFTRLRKQWATRIPGVEFLDDESFFGFPKKYWTRKMARPYLPPLDAQNPNLKEFLRQSGHETSVCIDFGSRCLNVAKAAKVPCELASMLRHWNAPMIAAMALLIFGVFKSLRMQSNKAEFCNRIFCRRESRVKVKFKED